MKYLAAILLLAGCATSPMMSQSDCLKADWERVGFQDGSRGEAPEFVDNHTYACKGTEKPLDPDAYKLGRERGLKQYCTPEGLYDAGQHGYGYHEVCEAKLKVHWQNGHERFALSTERYNAEKALDQRQKSLDDDHSVVGDISKGFHALTGQSQTATEQERIDHINDKIYKNEKLAPPGAQLEDRNDPRRIRQALGLFTSMMAGATGAVIGFGTGHVITGSYFESGWKFTALDAATMAGLLIVSHNCPGTTETASGRNVASTNNGCGAATAAAIVSFIGIRAWEAVSAVCSNQPTIALVPVGDTVGLGAVARW